jgi:tetratricopeptide (TPR) repeat protein
MAALSIVQDAVALSRPMLQQMIKPGSGSSSSVDDFNADRSCAAIFTLAKALSSLNHHLESYEASNEGFQTIIRLPIPSCLLLGECIDLFLNQICKVAEGGMFSLPMLVNCVILFCNLARIYPEQFSSQFLWLLHAYVYFAQQDDSPSMENICLFLEPKLDHPPPKLDVTRSMEISLGSDDGFPIEDVVWAFYTFPSHPSDHLIQNIFITHFDEAIVILQDVVEKLYSNTITIKWVLHTIDNIVLFLSTPNQLALLQVLARTIEHFGTILASQGSDWEWDLCYLFDPIFRHLWRTGLLNDTLQVCEQVIKYLDSRFKSDNVTVAAGYWRLNRHFILCDMGRYSDAIGLVQQATIASAPGGFFLHPYIIQIRILRRTGRNQEALQLLRKGVATSRQKYWTVDVQVFHLGLDFLFAEFAATWGYISNGEKALKHAERAVAARRKDIGPNEDVKYQKCILIHSLVTLSNCLATLGRNDEALTAAQEAVSVYTENAPHMWGKFLYTIRKQELGANAFHALSL